MANDKHLAYEVEQLCADLVLLERYWPGMHGATPGTWDDPVAIPVFEAFLLHARNLLEFVSGQSRHGQALLPGDFNLPNHDFGPPCDRFADGVGQSVEDVYSTLCTYVSHLSKERDDLDSVYWLVQPLSATLLEEVLRVVELAEEAGCDMTETRAAIEVC